MCQLAIKIDCPTLTSTRCAWLIRKSPTPLETIQRVNPLTFKWVGLHRGTRHIPCKLVCPTPVQMFFWKLFARNGLAKGNFGNRRA